MQRSDWNRERQQVSPDLSRHRLAGSPQCLSLDPRTVAETNPRLLPSWGTHRVSDVCGRGMKRVQRSGTKAECSDPQSSERRSSGRFQGSRVARWPRACERSSHVPAAVRQSERRAQNVTLGSLWSAKGNRQGRLMHCLPERRRRFLELR